MLTQLQSTGSGASRPVVKVDLIEARTKAERMCSSMTTRGALEWLKLSDMNRVEGDRRKCYRMWYPNEMPKRISSLEVLFHCKRGTQAAKGVEWDKILRQQSDVDVEMCVGRLLNEMIGQIDDNASIERRQKLEVVLPRSTTAIAITDGGRCDILRHSKSLSLLVDILDGEDIEDYRRLYCSNALKACHLNSSEHQVLCNYFHSNRMRKFKNPALIQFSELDDCESLLNAHLSSGRELAMYLPRSFTVGCDRWNSIDNGTMTFRIKWYQRPCTGVGIIRFSTAWDAQVAIDVLTGHGYSIEEGYSRFSADTKAISFIPISFQHDAVFEDHVRQMMEANGINVVTAYLQRTDQCRNEDTIHLYIGREIIDFLDRRGVWNGPTPWLMHEWRNLLYSEEVPWQWELLDNNNLEGVCTPCEAQLIMDSAELAVELADYLIHRPRTIYSRRNNVFQKIYVKPVFRITMPVTREVRIACDTFIRQLNNDEEAAGEGTVDEMQSLKIIDLTWDKAHDSCEIIDTCVGELSVEGWPIRRVQEVATRLLSLFEGTYIDCSDDIYGRLLYGHGAKYVDFAREKLRGKVVVDVDLLRERITIVGESADLCREKLKFFAENSHAFKLDVVITLGPPRYLCFMRDVLCSGVGIERLKEICGGADLEFVDNEGMKFSGTLEQYEFLTKYFDEVDERIVMSSSTRNASSKPTCPVCLSPVSDAFYSLECGHCYCLKCIIFQVKTMIRNRQMPIQCLYQNCEKPIAVSNLKELILGEERLPWLSAVKLRPLIDSSLDCIIREHPSLMRCPTPDCFGVCDITGKSGVIQCESCKKERCTGCMMEPHENLTCEEYSKLRTDSVASLKAYLSRNEGKVRVCPTEGCGAIIEKGEGCYHMQCSMCRIHFCWLCGYKSDQQSDVYGHLRENHGAFGVEWPAHFEVPRMPRMLRP